MNPRKFLISRLLPAVIVIAVMVPVVDFTLRDMRASDVRERVGWIKNGHRNLSSALHSYFTEHESYPLEGDPLADWGVSPETLDAVSGHSFRAPPVSLTTPVAYINGIPVDGDFGSWGSGYDQIPSAYIRVSGEPRYFLISQGPDGVFDVQPEHIPLIQDGIPLDLFHLVYDPSNGTISGGDIMRTHLGSIDPREGSQYERVRQTKQNHRHLSNAIHSYFADHGSYPPEGKSLLEWGINPQTVGEVKGQTFYAPPVSLTTPVGYLSAIPAFGDYGNWQSGYEQIPPVYFRVSGKPGYFLISPGPDRLFSVRPEHIPLIQNGIPFDLGHLIYSPRNGAISGGDIIRSHLGAVQPITNKPRANSPSPKSAHSAAQPTTDSEAPSP